jgi:hypothetical protein
MTKRMKQALAAQKRMHLVRFARSRRAKVQKRWTEKTMPKGVTPAMCGPDLIPERAGRELI